MAKPYLVPTANHRPMADLPFLLSLAWDYYYVHVHVLVQYREYLIP